MVGLAVASIVLAGVGGASLWTERQPTPTPTSSLSAAPALAASSLDELEEAFATGDAARAATLAVVGDKEMATQLAGSATNATSLRLSDLSLRYVTEVGDSHGASWAAVVEVRWRVGPVDDRVARTTVRAEFTHDRGRAAITQLGGDTGRTPLWLAGPAQVTWIGDSAVVVVADSPEAAPAADYVRLVRRGMRSVRSTVGGWSGGVVVQVPSQPAGVDQILGTEEDSTIGVAGVTTSADGSTGRRAPIRIVLDPAQIGGLSSAGAQVVVTHELTHVAIRSVTSAVAAPAWLDEGVADLVALRAVGVPLATSAADLIDVMRTTGVPDALPVAADFARAGPRRDAAYQASWLACREIEQRVGIDGLLKVHRAVSSGARVDEALREHVAISRRALVQRWRQRLSALRDRSSRPSR